jgi:transaldolase/glucose-6-phosphate isomerase
METLLKLSDYGQSYWLDNLSREKIKSGELKRRVDEEGLRGITSNPTIFNEAISTGNDYNEDIKKLVLQNRNLQEIYDELTIKDVQDVCDILSPVFKKSRGLDGFVSLEVSPFLAHDTEGTIREVRRLHKAVAKPNCMIKIPGTREGVPAIEQMLYEGININITLLFSIPRYIEIAQAYIRAISRRFAEGKEIKNIVSVASFFLSRIDTLTDQLLGQYIIAPISDKNYKYPERLFGKAAIASAAIAYKKFRSIFGTEEWQRLESKGANIQRVLWASTSTKDPLYDDLKYVEPLIGADTVNTLPDKTIKTFSEKGKLKKNAIEEHLTEAEQTFAELKEIPVDINFVTQQLENEGIQKFTDSFQQLMENLAQKRAEILKKNNLSQTISSGPLDKELKQLFTSLDEKQVAKRLFAKEPDLWKTDKENVQTINEGLGWLTLPDEMISRANKFIDFAEEIKEEGYTSVILLGMGGSSLCSEVAKSTFGSAKGYPQLYILDNTEPASILALEKKIDIKKTLFIVASKSGSTLETNCFFKFFYNELQTRTKDKTGKNFVAITDEKTSLVKLAKEYKFRKVFINVPGVGGRYSVLSDFGIIPMALMGINVVPLLNSAKQVLLNSGPDVPASVNPAISLGAILGLAQHKGRDKVTFVLSSSLKSFGFWLEQLIAESTGKEGKGLIPVNGEKLGLPSVYSDDRIFVHIFLASDSNTNEEKRLKLLEKAGHPVVRIGIRKKEDLGGAYYHWEIATAIAGMILNINPFDQPNVAESKENTNKILLEWTQGSSFKKAKPLLEMEGIRVFDGFAKSTSLASRTSLQEFIASFLRLTKEHDYIALLPYFELTPYRHKLMQQWREKMKNGLKEATTLLNGPRYLHSTGQLHKGGPDSGLYILITGVDKEDLPIPGEKYGFATLHMAQALGDFESLEAKGRKVIRIHFNKNIDAGLTTLCDLVRGNN